MRHTSMYMSLCSSIQRFALSRTTVTYKLPHRTAALLRTHLQRGLRLIQIGVGGRHVDEHERLGRPAQAVAHQHRELMVAVWDVCLQPDRATGVMITVL